jgi:hypothetical protein
MNREERLEHWRQLDSMFRQLLDDASFELPASDLEFVVDLVDHNEFGIAFESMLDSLREEGIVVSAKDLERIGALGKKMKFDDSRWRRIATNREAMP